MQFQINIEIVIYRNKPDRNFAWPEISGKPVGFLYNIIKIDKMQQHNFDQLLSKLFIVIMLLCGSQTLVFAQPDSIPNQRPQPTQQPIIQEPDTNVLRYFNWTNISERIDLNDTTLAEFQQYDAARQGLFYDYIHIGDVGSAAKPLAFTPTNRRGFEVGLHAYDIYQMPYDEVRFFDVNKDYTIAYYSQAQAQTDLIFKATYANSFNENRANIALDYNRISETALYNNQFARHTNLVVNSWFQTKNKRYTGLFAWLQNVNEQEMNGGVRDTATLFNTGQFNARSTININTSTAKTSLRSNEFIYAQYYSLLPNSDNLKLKHRANFQTFEYKFYDTSPASDSSYYGIFQTNNVGLRNFIQYNKLENEATIRLDYKGALDVGAVHSVYFLNQEPVDTTINNLFLIGDWDLILGEQQSYGLKLKAHFGLLDNRADYLLQGNLFFGLPKQNAQLNISASSRGYEPTLQQFRVYVSQQKLWETDFQKTIENKVSGRIDWSDKLSIQGNYFLINNLIFWDTLAFPQQSDTITNIGQLMMRLNLNIGSFHFDNAVVLQQTDNSILRFPTIATKHSLYFEGNLFKNALFGRVGLDIRYNTAYYFDNFQPVTGQFYQQNDWQQSLIPIVDGFASFQVKSFRAFLKLENLNHLIDANQVYFTAPNFPMRDWTFRFGVSWYFADGLQTMESRGSTSSPPMGVGGF